MKADYILKADILDIIFENKNKAYGAYALRKYYNERVYKALGIIFIIAMIFGLVAFLNKYKKGIVFEKPDVFWSTVVDLPVQEPTAPEPPKPPQRQVSSVAPIASASDQVPIIADYTSTNVEPPNEGDHTGSQDTGGNDEPAGGPGGAGENISTAHPTPVPPKIDNNTPMRHADILPSFPGGIEQLKKFLKKHLVAPKELEPDENISVTIQFVVGYDGVLKSFEIVEDGGEAFNNEVIRVIKKMPAWIPGRSHGENVSVYYSIPIKFTPTE